MSHLFFRVQDYFKDWLELFGREFPEDPDRIFRTTARAYSSDAHDLPSTIEAALYTLQASGLCYSTDFDKPILMGQGLTKEQINLGYYVGGIMAGLLAVDICPACEAYETLLEGPSGGVASSIKCSSCLTSYYVGLYCCVTKSY